MAKKYLQSGDSVFSTGVFLQWNGERFIVEGFEDDTFYDGLLVNFDEEGLPYIEKE